MTFGRVIEDMRPEHIDYAYGADLTMGNTGGKLRVVCGDTVIDDALYEDLGDGVSRQLDARIDPPDAEANDVLTNWCDGAEPYGDEFGTPGAANTKCPLVAPGCGQCFEGEELRDVIAPRPGQLVINEFMPNASSAPESVGEWFEVFVTDGPVDLNCLQYGGNTGKFAADPGDAESITAPAVPDLRGRLLRDLRRHGEVARGRLRARLLPGRQQDHFEPGPRHLPRLRRHDPRRDPLQQGQRRDRLEPRPRLRRPRRQRRPRAPSASPSTRSSPASSAPPAPRTRSAPSRAPRTAASTATPAARSSRSPPATS
jgi:hypothetical protein